MAFCKFIAGDGNQCVLIPKHDGPHVTGLHTPKQNTKPLIPNNTIIAGGPPVSIQIGGNGGDLSESGEYVCGDCGAWVQTGAAQAIHEAWHTSILMLGKQLANAYVMINKLKARLDSDFAKNTTWADSSLYRPYQNTDLDPRSQS